jgi:hypothetical protein
MKNAPGHVIPSGARELLLFVFDKKQPAAAGFAALIDFCIKNAIDCPSGGSTYAPTEGERRSAGGSPTTSVGLVR